MNTPINAKTSSEDKLKTIEPTSLKNLLDKQEVVLIDVRELEHRFSIQNTVKFLHFGIPQKAIFSLAK